MNCMQYQKWKRITVYDEKKRKAVCFELDSNERLKKSLKSKKVSKITKVLSLKCKKDGSNNHTKSSSDVPKKELSKNIIIFSRESNIDKFMLNANKTIDRKENSNSIKCNILEDFKILNFVQFDSMMKNEFYDWNDS